MPLETRSSCQAALPPDGEAFICSFECTFCSRCAVRMATKCSKCDGELVSRPRRKVAE